QKSPGRAALLLEAIPWIPALSCQRGPDRVSKAKLRVLLPHAVGRSSSTQPACRIVAHEIEVRELHRDDVRLCRKWKGFIHPALSDLYLLGRARADLVWKELLLA